MPTALSTSATMFVAAATIAAAASFFSAVALSIIAVRRWRGRWKLAAGLPLLALFFLIAIISIGIVRDPTAHNLWPFEFVLWGIASLTYLGALVLVRRLVKNLSR